MHSILPQTVAKRKALLLLCLITCGYIVFRQPESCAAVQTTKPKRIRFRCGENPLYNLKPDEPKPKPITNMHKFILLRGHEGSGKSFFAAEQAALFYQQYPDARIVLIDNDLALIDADGNYHFDFEKFAAAHRENMQRQQQAFAYAVGHPQENILVVNANPNQKAKTCAAQIQAALAHGFAVEIYRLHNFFANLHHVAEDDVLRSHARLDANPVADEIHVAAVRPMNEAQRQRLRQLFAVQAA